MTINIFDMFCGAVALVAILVLLCIGKYWGIDNTKEGIKKCGQDRIECYQRFLGMEVGGD